MVLLPWMSEPGTFIRRCGYACQEKQPPETGAGVSVSYERTLLVQSLIMYGAERLAEDGVQRAAEGTRSDVEYVAETP